MIFIVGHEKGGVGKSQIAFNLAAYFAERKKSVILVDTDTQRTSAKWSALREQVGRPPTFPVVERTTDPAPTIVQLSEKYDAVVVDVGARDYARLSDLAKIADLWIAPTRVGQGDLQSTMDLASAFSTLHSKHKAGHIPLCVVVNAVPGTWNSMEGEDAIQALKEVLPTGKVLAHSIRDRRVWRDAHRLGRSIFEMPPSAREKAEEEFVAVIDEALSAYKPTR